MSRNDENLPTDVDVIVLGTGLPESILAAACARMGLTVLHLDKNEFYGGAWASFNLDGIQKWSDAHQNVEKSSAFISNAVNEDLLQNGERICMADPKVSSFSYHFDASSIYTNVVSRWHIEPSELQNKSKAVNVPNDPPTDVPFAEQESKSEESSTIPTEVAGAEEKTKPDADAISWTKEKILGDWRRFSLDLTPRLLLGRGPMVDLLCHSNVGRYAEFKAVNRLLTDYDGELRIVPCSRSDVFQSTEITMAEKRMLMKFLTFCLNYDSEEESQKWKEHQNSALETFLAHDSNRLTPKLRHYVQNSLAMVAPDATTTKGLAAVREFLMSTGRYGNSPYLWCLYGSGELPQCFCRLCAVFGGIYCLRRTVEAWIFDAENRCTGIITEGQRTTCRHMIADNAYLPPELEKSYFSDTDTKYVSRAIVITDGSILKQDKEYISLLNCNVEGLPEPIKILEVGGGACVCPAGLYVVHMVTRGNRKTTAEQDFASVLKKFFSMDGQEKTEKPKILWSLFFNFTSKEPASAENRIASNVIITPAPGEELTYAQLVPEVQRQFSQLWPDVEFLPPSRNPDDIGGDVETIDDPGINGFTPDAEQLPHNHVPASPTNVNASATVGVESNRSDADENGERPEKVFDTHGVL